MKFNALIPELTVSNIQQTKDFYINILGFKLEFERVEDKFIFLSFENSQMMFEKYHKNGWNVAEMKFPFGRGANFEIAANYIDKLYKRVLDFGINPYRTLKTNLYVVNGKETLQKEFLVMDYDGYLLRFVD